MQIAEYRKLRGYTQKDLALKTGISIDSIRGYEQGRRDITCIELKKALAIANALEIKVEQLIQESNQ